MPILVSPGRSVQHRGLCSTCGHASGSATWRILHDEPSPTGTVQVEFFYSCGNVWDRRITTRHVGIGDLAYRTADQGAKDECGENAEIIWAVGFTNHSELSVEATLGIGCPKYSDTSSASPTAPSALGW